MLVNNYRRVWSTGHRAINGPHTIIGHSGCRKVESFQVYLPGEFFHDYFVHVVRVRNAYRHQGNWRKLVISRASPSWVRWGR